MYLKSHLAPEVILKACCLQEAVNVKTYYVEFENYINQQKIEIDYANSSNKPLSANLMI